MSDETADHGTKAGKPDMVRIDVRSVLVLIMTLGTVALVGLLVSAMLGQPFEPNDDLIWFTKLRRQSFSELPFSAAWMLSSPFYRPFAEIVLNGMYVLFGMDLAAYRMVQFFCFLALSWLGYIVVRQLRLPTELVLVLMCFCLGSPFLIGSIVWISELPHVVIVICFAAALTVILSGLTDNTKLALCGLAYSVAVLSKENGLALALFYVYFVPSVPLRAALVFGSITAGYLLLRVIVLGPSIGAGGVNESVGYLFDYLSQAEREAIFPGNQIYKLYLYNVAAQIGALLFRIAQWGTLVSHITGQVVIHCASTALIAAALIHRLKHRTMPRWLVILLLTIFGGTFFSYSYARDRHLALPAFAYGVLLIICCAEIGQRARAAATSSILMFIVWTGWTALAYRNVMGLPRSSIEIIEKSYRPIPDVQNPQVAPDIWISARRQALEIADH